jgi:hypothetical protein
MLKHWWLVGLALQGVGCSGKTDEEPAVEQGWHSGSRLRARVLDGRNRAQEFVGWHDLKLGMDCAFDRGEDGKAGTLAADGKQRCLPTEPAGVIYADAACSVVGVSVSACADGQQWFAVTDTVQGAPESRTRVYRALGAAPATLYRAGDSGCQVATLRESEEALLAVEVDPATFVGAEEHLGPTSGEIAPRVLKAEDGASTVVGFHDVVRDADCFRETWYGPGDRCLPFMWAGAWVGTYFSDASCTERVAKNYSDQVPEVAFGNYTEGCRSAKADVYAVGKRHDGPVYRGQGATCVLVTDTSPATYYRYGADISSTFPLLETRRSTRGTVRADRVIGADVPMPAQTRFVLGATGEACSVARLAGGLRCVPWSAQSPSRLFADAGCSALATEWWLRTDCAPPESPKLVYVDAPATVGQCAGDQTVHHVGELWSGDVYSMVDEACVSYPRQEGHAYARLSAPALPSEFPQITERTE